MIPFIEVEVIFVTSNRDRRSEYFKQHSPSNLTSRLFQLILNIAKLVFNIDAEEPPPKERNQCFLKET